MYKKTEGVIILLEKVEAYCLDHDLFKTGDCLVMACSGGPDSLALLDVLSRLKAKYSLQLVVCYVHHGIRKAADAEVAFVRHESELRQCRFECYHVDVPALAAARHESEETTGRIERYRILRQLASSCGAAAIAVAHHQGDQAETVMHHLLRGSGISGLTGMRPKTDGIIRPFLSVTRQEIETYNAAHDLHPCEDETNHSLAYTRNRIRLELLPEMAQFNPAIISDLNRLADIAQGEDDFLTQCADDLFNRHVCHHDDQYSIAKAALLSQPLAMKRRLLRKLFQLAGNDSLPVPYHYINQVLQLAHSDTGHRFDTGHVCVYTTYDDICFAPAGREIPGVNVPMARDEQCVRVDGDGSYQMGPYTLTIQTTQDRPADIAIDMYLMDKAKNPGNLELRFRRAGDTIHIGFPPMGKAIKKYFIDQKIPVTLRNTIPLLCSGSEVLWAFGHAGNTKTIATADTEAFIICKISGGDCHAW